MTKNGFGKVIIGETLIQEVLSSSNEKDKIKIKRYKGVFSVSSKPPEKKNYIFRKIGITYIVSIGDTITGINFYSPFSGETEKGIIIGQTKTSSLIGAENEIVKRMKKNDFYNHLKSKPTNKYRGLRFLILDEIKYGFTKNDSTISEIRIRN